MNFYKKLIRSKELRLRILRALSWVPDKTMLKIQYRIKTGKKLNLYNPQRYTEKLQWYKLNYRNTEMVVCADKYDVRQFVEKRGLGYILNDCYGVFDNPDEIDYNKLPHQFVLKDTLGGGGSSVIIVDDKERLNQQALASTLQKWVDIPIVSDAGREWPYYFGKKHRIIAEKRIEADPNSGGLIDYKFFCFNGVPKFLYVIADRNMGVNAGLGIYDIEYTRLPFVRLDESPLCREIPKPENYDKMVEIASILAKGFPHVRVDLYNQNGRIIFGELTFFDGSGYMRYEPDEFDFIMGEQFQLPPVAQEDKP